MPTSTSLSTVPPQTDLKCQGVGFTGDTHNILFQIGERAILLTGTGEVPLTDAEGNAEVTLWTGDNSTLTITFWSSSNPDPYVRSMALVQIHQSISWRCGSQPSQTDDNEYSASYVTWYLPATA